LITGIIGVLMMPWYLLAKRRHLHQHLARGISGLLVRWWDFDLRLLAFAAHQTGGGRTVPAQRTLRLRPRRELDRAAGGRDRDRHLRPRLCDAAMGGKVLNGDNRIGFILKTAYSYSVFVTFGVAFALYAVLMANHPNVRKE